MTSAARVRRRRAAERGEQRLHARGAAAAVAEGNRRQVNTAPSPATLSSLKARNAAGWSFFALAAALSIAGTALASTGGWIAWAAGQAMLAAALVEWFVLLHECGHGTLFATRRLNVVAGHVAGFFALIPFPIWTRVHGRHHKWTGWQDLDPTTAALVPKPRGPLERHLVNFCWRYWVPLFSVLYRTNNFWDLHRIVRLFPQPEVHRGLVRSAVAIALCYVALAWAIGPVTLARVAGVALVLALIVEDVLLISQHTHIPMKLAHGGAVAPVAAIDQETFTRSMRLPALASAAALHIDAHELHHMYPFVPGYRLGEIAYAPLNEVSWRRWVLAARAVPGEVLLFQHRHETGLDL